MNTYDIDELIMAFLSGKTTPEDRKFLETWIQSDPSHKRYFQKALNIHQGLHPVFHPDNIDEEHAKKQIFRHINKKYILQTILLYWQRIAAFLVIPCLIAGIYFFAENRKAEKQEIIYQEITSPHGMYSYVQLPDGSNVWLNSGSSLKFPIHFTEKNRNVFLNGEGYFEVEADPKKNFIVTTEQMILQATGTAFNIEAYKKDSIIAVTLAKGTVDVSLTGLSTVSLHPGERIHYNNRTFKKSITKTDPYKWYAWKEGKTIFRDDPLEYVFKRLSLLFNVDILLKDPELAGAPYRATFEGESLGEILRLLELTAPIRFLHIEQPDQRENHFRKQKIEVHKHTAKK